MIGAVEAPRSTMAPVAPFEFTLPEALEATEPAEARGLARDEVRLLVSNRADGRMVDAAFRDLPWFLDAGDLVVVNDSYTLPAALTAQRTHGEELALHLSTRVGRDTWIVEPRAQGLAAGERLTLPGGGAVRLLAPHRESSRLWLATVSVPGDLPSYLGTLGRPISYRYVTRPWPLEAYQTVYAVRRGEAGSAEMPSAGRPFTDRVLEALDVRGVGVTAITLHTGVASLEVDEPPYEEWYDVSQRAEDAIAATRARGGRVIAVGTTVIRTLESALDAAGTVRAGSGWTDLVVTPARPVRSVDGLLTGLHEPRASHLQMLSALAEPSHLRAAYEHAIEGGYLWHEFGDVHLIL